MHRVRNFIIYYVLYPCSASLLISCSHKEDFDASGTFESTEVIVSSEANGEIMRLTVDEGQQLDSGQQVGYIDTIQLYLKKKELLSNADAILSSKPDKNKEIAVIEQQIANAEKEQRRYQSLVNTHSVPKKQLDDINEQLYVLRKQLAAQKSSLTINIEGKENQSIPVKIQAEQIEDQIQKSIIINPVSGTVLTTYAEPGELATSGKPLYRIADLSILTLRAYITNSQLSQVKVGQFVKVYVDSTDEAYRIMNGKITWISDKAEFTPKTIQTKDERANLVYAVKIDVKNDGRLKIGMYGDVKFNWEKSDRHN